MVKISRVIGGKGCQSRLLRFGTTKCSMTNTYVVKLTVVRLN